MSPDSTSVVSPERRARSFSYEGLRLEVSATQESHLDWLTEFLTPHFGTESDGHTDIHIAVRQDDGAYRELREHTPPSTPSLIDCFALDSSVIQLPIWRSDARATTVFDEHYKAFYTVSSDGSRVELLAAADSQTLRTPLMRVVRELAMNHCHARGGLFLHAAGVAFGEKGLLITGHKSAGKTTLLLYLLRSKLADYVANDRILVDPIGDPVRMQGLPSVVTIRPRTLELFPRVHDRLAERSFRQQWTLAEAAQKPPGSVTPWHDGRYGITPAQLLALCDARPVAGSSLTAVVFPIVTEKPGGLELHPVAPEIAAERLVPCLLGAGTWKKHSDFFTLQHSGAPGPDAETLTQLCRTLAEKVPCFDCHLGLDAYVGRDGVECLREIVHGRSER